MRNFERVSERRIAVLGRVSCSATGSKMGVHDRYVQGGELPCCTCRAPTRSLRRDSEVREGINEGPGPDLSPIDGRSESGSADTEAHRSPQTTPFERREDGSIPASDGCETGR